MTLATIHRLSAGSRAWRDYLRPRYVIRCRGPLEVDRSLRNFERVRIPKDLLPLDMLRALPGAEPPALGGVYFLWHGPELLYIGESIDIAYRVHCHRLVQRGIRNGKKMPFTHSTHMPLAIEKDALVAVETDYIRAYRPPYNDKVL